MYLYLIIIENKNIMILLDLIIHNIRLYFINININKLIFRITIIKKLITFNKINIHVIIIAIY